MTIDRRFHKRRSIRIAVLLALLAITGWIVADTLTGVKLRREINTYREHGYPVSPDDLARPDIRPEEDAGLMYERAFWLLTSTEVAAKYRAMQLPSPEEWIERDDNAPSILDDMDFRIAMDFGKRAGARAQLNVFDFDDFDWDTAFQLHLLHLRAAVEAKQRNDQSLAANHIEASLRMASHLARNEGPILATLFAMAIHETTLPLIESYLRLQDMEIEDLEAWLSHLDVPAGNQRMVAAFRHDATLIWQALNHLIYHPTQEAGSRSMKDYLHEFPTTRNRWRARVFRPLLKLDLAENLRIYRTVADRLSAPASNMVPLDETDLFANVPRYALVARSLDRPWLSRIMPDVIGDEVALTIARAAIASELFRRRHGNWPRESDELAPAFLDDAPRHPLTAAPVEFRLDDNTLHLSLELSDERFPGLNDTTYSRNQLNRWTLSLTRITDDID